MMASADVRLPLRVKPLLNGRDNNPIRLAGQLVANMRFVQAVETPEEEEHLAIQLALCRCVTHRL